MGCAALELAGRWVELGLRIEAEISGRALTDWYYMGLGGFVGPMSWTRLSHLRGSGLTAGGAPWPCQPCGCLEVWGLLSVFGSCSVGVVPHVDVFLMYLWGGRWSPRVTPPPSWRSSLFTPPVPRGSTFHLDKGDMPDVYLTARRWILLWKRAPSSRVLKFYKVV